MFNKDFYPTPPETIEVMTADLKLRDSVILDPSAGSGNIIDWVKPYTDKILSCEINSDLAKIAASKSQLIGEDFLTVQSKEISHVDYILMNPPFSKDVKHILHAFEIAPKGCVIRALMNEESYNNAYTAERKRLKTILSQEGNNVSMLGACFQESERKTNVNVALLHIQKGAKRDEEFFGYFETEDSEIYEEGEGIMSYNAIRDIVNRVVGAIKLYDDVLDNAIKMNALTRDIRTCDSQGNPFVFTCSSGKKEVSRDSFAKAIQKNAWNSVFKEMKMDKYVTRSLLEDLNRFVEKNQDLPFTMKNVYTMIDTILGTHGERMNQAIEDVFDTLTKHYHDNRYQVEGWKTNSHYVLNKKFILPCMTDIKYGGGMGLTHRGNPEKIEDLNKALCYITGTNYEEIPTLWTFLNNTYETEAEFCLNNDVFKTKMRRQYSFYLSGGQYKDSELAKKWKIRFPTFQDYLKSEAEKAADGGHNKLQRHYKWNTWYDWGFFQFKGFKKGTMHFKFKDVKVWELFNRRVAELRGYPLPEPKKKAEKKPEDVKVDLSDIVIPSLDDCLQMSLF